MRIVDAKGGLIYGEGEGSPSDTQESGRRALEKESKQGEEGTTVGEKASQMKMRAEGGEGSEKGRGCAESSPTPETLSTFQRMEFHQSASSKPGQRKGKARGGFCTKAQ